MSVRSYSQHNQTCPYKSALQTPIPHQVGEEAQNKTWIWGFGREGSTQQTPLNQQFPNKTAASRPSLSNPKASDNNESHIK